MFIRWSIFGFLVNYKKNADIRREENRVFSTIKWNDDIRHINISGFDARPILNTEDEVDIMIKVEKHFMKMKLLTYLETNNKLPDPHKLLRISNYNKDNFGEQYKPNITKGGLFKDWDFVF